VFVGQIISGYAGHQRRLFNPYQYTFLEHLKPLNQFVSYAAFVLGASQVLFVINFFKSMFAGEKAEQNPWGIDTLE
jgi:cytochrome c oxidase subunit 1